MCFSVVKLEIYNSELAQRLFELQIAPRLDGVTALIIHSRKIHTTRVLFV